MPGYYRAAPPGQNQIAIEMPRIILELHGSILGLDPPVTSGQEQSQTVLIFVPFNSGLFFFIASLRLQEGHEFE